MEENIVKIQPEHRRKFLRQVAEHIKDIVTTGFGEIRFCYQHGNCQIIEVKETDKVN
jgi:hypothetical protein